MKRFIDALREMEFEGPRVAVALLPLVFFGFLYVLAGLMGDDSFRPLSFGMAGCYLGAFVALAAGWFWARWFASGIGWSGAVMGLFGLVLQPDLWELHAIIAGLHALVVVMLMGKKMAAKFDMQPKWRERFGMDEFGVVRLGRAVTRASAALPGLVFMALKPDGTESSLVLVGATLGIVGLAGLLRLRTWGVLALGSAAVAMMGAGASAPVVHTLALGLPDPTTVASASPGMPAALSLVLFAAALPFARGAVRYYRSLQ
jgi:hypothetical protein